MQTSTEREQPKMTNREAGECHRFRIFLHGHQGERLGWRSVHVQDQDEAMHLARALLEYHDDARTARVHNQLHVKQGRARR